MLIQFIHKINHCFQSKETYTNFTYLYQTQIVQRWLTETVVAEAELSANVERTAPVQAVESQPSKLHQQRSQSPLDALVAVSRELVRCGYR